jgi:hypothetical protein
MGAACPPCLHTAVSPFTLWSTRAPSLASHSPLRSLRSSPSPSSLLLSSRRVRPPWPPPDRARCHCHTPRRPSSYCSHAPHRLPQATAASVAHSLTWSSHRCRPNYH